MTPAQRQWLVVALVALGLVGAATALVFLNPDVKGVQPGAEAPDYRAAMLPSGDSVAIPEHYEGHVTLVNVWATWCIPCRVEMPAMQEVYAAYKPKGFRIAAVSIDEGDAEPVLAFTREMGLTFDILQDRRGAIQQVYQTTGVPESFLLDKRGVIVKREIGARDWNSESNRRLIERLLEEPAP
jgi:cytochrome c biogenesis protein CcmG, thiol:disulfide interchange protein DsbE